MTGHRSQMTSASEVVDFTRYQSSFEKLKTGLFDAFLLGSNMYVHGDGHYKSMVTKEAD